MEEFDQQTTQAVNDEIQLVCFVTAKEEYGFPILMVKEIVRLDKVIKLPNLPSFLDGVMDLRDQMIPLMSLRKKFGLEQQAQGDQKVLILKASDNDAVGIIVDDISEIITANKQRISSLNSSVIGKRARHLKGIIKHQGRSIILLDLSTFLTGEEIDFIKSTNLETDADYLKSSAQEQMES